MERTLVLVKPDGVQRGLIGEIVARFERKGLKVVGLRLLTVPRQMAEQHYAVHAGKYFYEGLVEFITGPVAAVALEGPDAIATVRRLVGATMPNEADPGDHSRAQVGLRNLIHASDGAETARDELALWFGAGELLDYEREVDAWTWPWSRPASSRCRPAAHASRPPHRSRPGPHRPASA